MPADMYNVCGIIGGCKWNLSSLSASGIHWKRDKSRRRVGDFSIFTGVGRKSVEMRTWGERKTFVFLPKQLLFFLWFFFF